MNPGSPVGGEPAGEREAEELLIAGLVEALAPALRAPLGERASRAARMGAVAVLPAVLALRDLRGATAGPWNGMIHRRCEWRPAETTAGTGSASTSPVIDRRSRAGWDLLRARCRVVSQGRDWLVTHDLAQRAGRSLQPVEPAVPAESEGPDGAAAGSDSDLALRVSASQAAAWARASGDCNEIHLRPGAPRAAGLAAGPGKVVAHGLMLGALSFALTGGGQGGGLLRFPAPATIPAESRHDEQGVGVTVERLSGRMLMGGAVVLERR